MHAHKFRSLVLILLAGLLLCGSLTGCAKPAEAPSGVDYTEMLAMMNRTIDAEFSEAISSPHWWGTHGGRIWATGYQPHPERTNYETYEMWVASCLPDGSELASMQLTAEFHPELAQQLAQIAEAEPELVLRSYQQLYGLAWDSTDQMYAMLYESLASRTVEEEYFTIHRELYTLCTVSAEGTLQRVLQLTADEELLGGPLWLSPGDFLFDADDTLWVCSYLFEQTGPDDTATNMTAGNSFLRYDIKTGECIAQLPLPEHLYSNHEVLLPDGRLLLTVFAASNKAHFPSPLMTIDCSGTPRLEFCSAPDTENLGLPWRIIQGTDGSVGDVLLLQTNLGIARWDPQEEKGELLLEWESYNIDQYDQINPVFFLSAEQFLLISGMGSQSKLRILTLTDQDALASRPTVTISLPAMNSEQLQTAIHAYNAKGPEVYVKMELYSDIAAITAGYDSAEEMLKDRLITHTAADILLLPNTLYLPNYAHKGLYLDLASYLDTDPELAREDLLPGILSACEYGDTLPSLILNFGVWTAVGAPETVGGQPGLGWEEYNALVAAYPSAVPYYGLSRHNILLYTMQGGKFVDYEAGKAQLDTPEFIRLLEATASYPAQFTATGREDPKPAFAGDQALMRWVPFTGFHQLLTEEYIFNGPVVFKGFPADSPGGSSTVTPQLRVAINSDCETPEAAWAFVRTLLLPEYQQNMTSGFPVRQDTLQALAAAACETGSGSIPLFLDPNQLTDSQKDFFAQPLTQAQADQILALVSSLNTVYRFDSPIVDIVWEEAEYFYNGVRSAAEAAAIMQNRIQTYLDEQG